MPSTNESEPLITNVSVSTQPGIPFGAFLWFIGQPKVQLTQDRLNTINKNLNHEIVNGVCKLTSAAMWWQGVSFIWGRYVASVADVATVAETGPSGRTPPADIGPHSRTCRRPGNASH